jgi:hypothetical protein
MKQATFFLSFRACKYFVSPLCVHYNLKHLLFWGHQALLNEEQKDAVADYQRSKHENMQRELEAKVKERLKGTAAASRNVTALFKVRCVDAGIPTSTQSAMLSVWRPSEDVTQLLKEGVTVTLFNISAVGIR